MSRIGRQPITVPSGVEVTLTGATVAVKGPKGTLTRQVAEPIVVRQEDGALHVERPNDERHSRADKLPRVLGGLGVAVLSTSHGLMTDKEAHRRRVGGEVLCYVW